MAYNANIPQPTDRISASQGQILDNFSSLQTVFGVNHVTFNAPSNLGKHHVVTFPQQAAAPGVFAATEFGLYNKVNTTGSNVSELYVRRGNIGVNLGIPFTAGYVPNGAPNYGYTYLPSGLLIKFGLFTTYLAPNPNEGTYIQDFFVAGIPALLGPAFLYAPFVTATVNQGGGNSNIVVITGVTQNDFRVKTMLSNSALPTAVGGINVYWMAIGK